MIFFKKKLLDHWESNASIKLLVRNESDCYALVSWIDEILPYNDVGLGISDIPVTVRSFVVFRNSVIFAL